MNNHVLTETARGLISAEQDKIRRLMSRGMKPSLRLLCNDLLNYLVEEAKTADWTNRRDLSTLVHEITAISDLVNLLAAAAADRSSWWAAPLIRECYEQLDLDGSREVLIVHSDEIRDFCVYPDLLTILPRRVLTKGSPIVDLFEIPLDARHDLATIALVGHEAGHIHFSLKGEELLAPLNDHAKWNEMQIQLDLFSTEIDGRLQRISAHLMEHICDAIGRHLLGPAFDIALIKTLLPFTGQSGRSSTHPPEADRIRRSLDCLCQSCHVHGESLPMALKRILNGWEPVTRDLTISAHPEDQLVRELANIVIEESRFSEPLGTERLEKTWALVMPELAAFRPPFEEVSLTHPHLITPLQAVAATTIYYYGEHYKSPDGSDYFEYTDADPQEKEAVIRRRLVDHLVYMVGLYDFVRDAHVRQDSADFKGRLLQSPLWKMRIAKSRDRSNPLVVTPSIAPVHQYGQNAVDLRLGPFFLVHRPPRYTHMSPRPEGEDDIPLEAFYEEVALPTGETFILHPHQFVLASTLEYVSLPYDYYALVLGRSTWGRLGLNIATATTVQAGFRGCLTLELRNLGETPLPLTVGSRIAQLCLVPVPSGSASEGYYASGGKYVGPVHPEIPHIREDPDWALFHI